MIAQALRFHQCNNLQLSGLSHINSPRNHIGISDCNGVTISHIQISAPENSPNTDGIDVSTSTHVSIRDSQIGTGKFDQFPPITLFVQRCFRDKDNSKQTHLLNYFCLYKFCFKFNRCFFFFCLFR